MPTHAHRILIVEDHAITRAVMARMIQAQGFTVASACTLAEARLLAEAGDIGFLISDLGLGDGTGWMLMSELHTCWGINGAAISGFGMESDIERSSSAAFMMHLTKPIDRAGLDRILNLAREEIAKLPPLVQPDVVQAN